MKNPFHFFLFILGISCFLLSACSVGKPYVKQNLNLPDSFRYQAENIDSIHTGSVEWKDFFSDAILKTLIDSAIVNNFDMRTAIKNIQTAKQILLQSKAAYGPDINLDIAQYSKLFYSEHSNSNPSSNYYGDRTAPSSMFINKIQHASGINLSWELDIWGRIKQEKEASLAEYLQSDEVRKAVQTQLVADIAQGYYNLLGLDAQLKVAETNQRLNDSTLKIIELQYEAGEVTSLAREQTEAQKLIAEALIPQLEQEIAVQENALLFLTGKMPGEITRQAWVVDFDLEDSLSVGVPLQLVSYRPDVHTAELALRAANARIGVAQSYHYPSLSINIAGGLDAMLAENWFNIPGALFGTITGGITQPLFNRRKLKTNYELAKLDRDKAEIDFQKSVFLAVNDVSNALVSLQKLKEQYIIAEKRVDVSRLAVKHASMLFKSGMANYLEVLNAQSNSLESELDLVGLKLDRLNARVDLYRSLGGGWK